MSSRPAVAVEGGHGRPADFRHRAACRWVDPAVFFPVAEDGPVRDAQVGAAKAICAGCPVLERCRVWALVALPYGVAGGMSEDERRTVRARGRAGGCRASRRRAGGSQTEVAAAGRAAIRAGGVPRVVAAEFGVSARTAQRWASQIRDAPTSTSTSASTDSGGEGPGWNQALHQISQHGTQAGTRAEGHRF